MNWLKRTRYDPITPLISSGDEAIAYFVRRDLLDEDVEPADRLWRLAEVQKRLRKQQPDGSFKHSGKRADVHPPHHYPLLETWKQFRFLVEQYAIDKTHSAGRRAAEYLFGCQTDEGDIRGLIANQYAPYYTGAIMGLLIKAGYARDPRITKGFEWLLSMRQDDGGWVVPIQTHKLSREELYRVTAEDTEPLGLDRSQPFAHNCTGMVLRAFAAHPSRRNSAAAQAAANLLKGRFFRPDAYSSYRAASYWVRFQYPFWWNNLLAALDSLSLIGLPRTDAEVARGLAWLIEHQAADGLWELDHARTNRGRGRPTGANEMRLWVTLAICRILRRYFG